MQSNNCCSEAARGEAKPITAAVEQSVGCSHQVMVRGGRVWWVSAISDLWYAVAGFGGCLRSSAAVEQSVGCSHQVMVRGGRVWWVSAISDLWYAVAGFGGCLRSSAAVEQSVGCSHQVMVRGGRVWWVSAILWYAVAGFGGCLRSLVRGGRVWWVSAIFGTRWPGLVGVCDLCDLFGPMKSRFNGACLGVIHARTVVTPGPRAVERQDNPPGPPFVNPDICLEGKGGGE